jgi:hypothetical protein
MGSSTSKNAEMEKARAMLESAQAATGALKARLEQLGFNTTKLQEGHQLYIDAGGVALAVFAKLGDQEAATKAVNALRAKTEDQVHTLTRIAKQVFSDDVDALVTLGLRDSAPTPKTGGPTPETPEPTNPPKASRPSRAQAAFLAQAHRLYDGALADEGFVTKLATVGYTRERLAAELADVTALEAADITQEGQKGGLKGNRLAQQKARTDLKAWLKRYSGIVTAGMKDHPEWLTTLTLKARGGKR